LQWELCLQRRLFSSRASAFPGGVLWRELRFCRTLNAPSRVADKVQPALLVVTIISTAILSSSVDGSGEVFGWVATTGFVSILLGSLVYLVPLQRRMIRTGSDPAVPIPEMRSRWIKGHLTRTAVALASFALLAIAVFVSA
jgi:hypothetical protein